jgi:hypothetical protein
MGEKQSWQNVHYGNTNKYIQIRITHSNLECCPDDLLHGGQILVPEDLSLLLECKYEFGVEGSNQVYSLEKGSLVSHYRGPLPVYHFREGKDPTIGNNYRNTTGSECFKESEGAQSTTARNEAECRVLEKRLVVISASKRKVMS